MTRAGAKPVFSRRLTRTSTQKRLPVPPRCLPDFPNFHGGHAVEMEVLYETEVYPMVCTTRTRGRYAKPVLSKGWIEFARKTQLEVGDKVTLSKVHRPQEGGTARTVYVMEVERAVPVLIKQEAKASGTIAPVNPITTEPFGAGGLAPSGPNTDKFLAISSDQADDQDRKDRERFKQKDVGGPSKSLQVKIFGVWFQQSITQ